jgi:hypothetical protein
MEGAWTFFYPGDRDAQTWVADQARTILTGRAVDAAATIRHQADEAGFRGSERTGADEAAAYLTRKAPYLNYATALASGWQIATGIIRTNASRGATWLHWLGTKSNAASKAGRSAAATTASHVGGTGLGSSSAWRLSRQP